MKKIVINKCFGGFSISARAAMRYAELKGIPCYFFKSNICDLDRYTPITMEEAEKDFMFTAFTVPNPNDILCSEKDWREMTMEERQAHNKKYESIEIETRHIPRDDPTLVQVVKELGKKANGKFADLKIVKIPDGVEWEIDEYDGLETIDEKHRSWG